MVRSSSTLIPNAKTSDAIVGVVSSPSLSSGACQRMADVLVRVTMADLPTTSVRTWVSPKSDSVTIPFVEGRRWKENEWWHNLLPLPKPTC